MSEKKGKLPNTFERGKKQKRKINEREALHKKSKKKKTNQLNEEKWWASKERKKIIKREWEQLKEDMAETEEKKNEIKQINFCASPPDRESKIYQEIDEGEINAFLRIKQNEKQNAKKLKIKPKTKYNPKTKQNLHGR